MRETSEAYEVVEHDVDGASQVWRVCLKCPTPLRAKIMMIGAVGQEEARQKFCDYNGISGSSQEWEITRARGNEDEQQPEQTSTTGSASDSDRPSRRKSKRAGTA